MSEFLNGRVIVHHGDSAEVLQAFGEESVDAVVCDPPYGLGVPPDPWEMLRAWLDTGHLDVKGSGFMGHGWDAFVPQPALWREVFRVLKPGGHVLAFFGTRTYDLGSLAIRLAGFEIRDLVAWIYGSGFPKSMDVAKAIDKRRVEDAEPVRRICRVIRSAMDAKGLKSRHITEHFGGCNPRLIDHWAARDTDSQPALPTWDQWEVLRGILEIDAVYDAEVRRLNDRKGEFGEEWHAREVVGEVEEWSNRSNYALTSRDGLRRGSASSDAARDWEGWGTALKPALDPVCFARKPFRGTVAANVLAHGTGALNIAETKVGGPDGRWPANVVHDGSQEVVEAFPPEAGAGAPVRGTEASAATSSVYGERARVPGVFHADTGSAARFFYSAKAGSADRIYRGDPGANGHPTVKPLALMQWLCRLVTPPGGVVLDPFAGTGTTGEAAWREGFRAVLIERDDASVADIHRRMKLADRPSERRAFSRAKGVVADDAGPLFRGIGS